MSMTTPTPDRLVINEIYASLQGESTWAGLPCIFVRLTGCNLRCSYCDTAYAFKEGEPMGLQAVLAEVDRLAEPWLAPGPGGSTGIGIAGVPAGRLPLVELTGGEPLLQSASLGLMRTLCDRGYTVLLETSGALDISGVDARVKRIVDLKCPSSGESGRNRWENLGQLKAGDELKFVVTTWEDYAWAKGMIQEHALIERCAVLMSWASPLTSEQRVASLKVVPAGHRLISRRELAEAIVADRVPIRFQVQMHKVIWAPDERGV